MTVSKVGTNTDKEVSSQFSCLPKEKSNFLVKAEVAFGSLDLECYLLDYWKTWTFDIHLPDVSPTLNLNLQRRYLHKSKSRLNETVTVALDSLQVG